MENIMMNTTEILIFVGLLFGIIKFWKWKLNLKLDLQTTNIAFGVFLSGQILSITFILFFSMDPQNDAYLESLSWYDEGAINFWNIIGIQISGVLIIYYLTNIIVNILVKILLNNNISIYEDIKNQNLSILIISSVSLISVGFISSIVVLRPFIFDWIAEKATLVPIY
jgi:hypothetical protein